MRARLAAGAALMLLTAGCAIFVPPGPRLPTSSDPGAVGASPVPVPASGETGAPGSSASVVGTNASGIEGASVPSTGAARPAPPLSPVPAQPELPPTAIPPPAAPPPPSVAKPSGEAPAPAPVEPPPAPPPPVVAIRVPHEDQIVHEVTLRLTKAQEIIDRIDASRLSQDQREIFSSIRDFVAKARDAFKTKDMPRAQVLAEKASRLADDLATTVKR